MRVLHIFNTYLPKTQTWAFNLLRFTPDVEVFVGAYSFLPDSWWEDRFTKVRSQVTEKVDGLVDKLAYRLLSKKQQEKVRRRKVNRLIEKVWMPALEKHQIDLVHVHFANIGWECLELKRRTGILYVVSFYGMDYEYIPYQEPAYIGRYQELLREADGIICEGPHGKKILTERYGADPAKVQVAPLGVEVNQIPFYERDKKPGELKLVQIASYVEKKGHYYTINAFAEALKTCPEMELTLVGKGPLLEDMQALVAKLSVEAKVRFVPFIDYALLYDFLREHHVFIHPSCYSTDRDCEGGAPIVMLDAQATGMPVIATTHCDIPAEVVDGLTGLLTEEKDVAALAGSIQVFYEMEQDRYREFAVAAREHVVDAFSISKNTALNSAAYREVLEKR